MDETIEKPIHKSNLVFSGGGIKGISFIGVLFALDELGELSHFNNFIGTSIGGFMLAMHILGYTASELYEFVKLFNIPIIKDINILNLEKYGLDSGARLEHVIKYLIKSKNHHENITLGELHKKTNKTLTVTSVCVNTIEVCYLSHVSHPDLCLYTALRMTMALPLYYCPVYYNNKYYIDGGCLENYPIRIMKLQLDSTLGVYICDKIENVESLNNIEEYLMRLGEIFILSMDFNSPKDWGSHTMCINTDKINIIDYDIGDSTKDKLFLRGYETVMNNMDKLKFG